MSFLESQVSDLSRFEIGLSKLELDIINLFHKIKLHFLKSNPLNYDYLVAHLHNCIKLFNDLKIDSVQLKNSVKSLFDDNFTHFYYDFVEIMEKIQKENCRVDIKNMLLSTRDVNFRVRKDLKFTILNDGGPSYRILPSDYNHKTCSGRVHLTNCSDCLNNDYICFPSMISEDTSAVSSKKNMHEEQINKLEDERYEVDMFQEINKYALKHLCEINKRMETMSKEEKLKFQLDDSIGGSSAILMRKAIFRIYGDATDNMIEGLKVRPKMAIPLVISRMQEKAKEWNQIHSKFKMVWEDRANKHYWQSLDYQGDWTKRDAVFLKRSVFFSQIDSLSKGFLTTSRNFLNSDFVRFLSKTDTNFVYDHMVHTQNIPKGIYGNILETPVNFQSLIGPHLTLLFPAESELFGSNTGISMKDIIENSNKLIMNQIHFQNNLSKEDKHLLFNFFNQIVGYFFGTSGINISNFMDDVNKESKDRNHNSTPLDRKFKCKRIHNDKDDYVIENKSLKMSDGTKSHNYEIRPNPLKYKLMIGNSYMYTFLRLFHVLIDRLSVLKIYSSKTFQDDNDLDDFIENGSNEENDCYNKVLKILIDNNELNSEASSTIDNKIRILYNTKTFLWLTIPRIVQQIVKVSQQIVCTGLESSKDLLDIYYFHSKCDPSGTGGLMTNRELYLPQEIKYVNESIDFCISQGLLCFLFVFFRQEGRLLIQMIDTDSMKKFNGSSNAYSECESPSPDFLKPMPENIHQFSLNLYGKTLEEISKNKSCQLFLTKNLKRGIRKMTDNLLNYWKFRSISRNFPSMEEIIYMKNKSNIMDCLSNPINELYRSAFVGAGDIYDSLFNKNLKGLMKNGYLLKKNAFSKKKSPKVNTKRTLEEILNCLKSV